jgi:hypothetical protein
MLPSCDEALVHLYAVGLPVRGGGNGHSGCVRASYLELVRRVNDTDGLRQSDIPMDLGLLREWALDYPNA